MGVKDQSPVLRRAAAVPRVDALFGTVSHDHMLRQQFKTNPVGVLSEYVSGLHIPAEQTATSNQLIYSVLSDSNLLSWLHTGTPGRAQGTASVMSTEVPDEARRRTALFS